MWIFSYRFLGLLLNYQCLRYLDQRRFTNEKKQVIVFFILERDWPHPDAFRTTRSRRIYFELDNYTGTPSPLMQSRRLSRQLLPVLVFPTKLTNPTGSWTLAMISSASWLIYILPLGLIFMSCTGLPVFSWLILFWSNSL